MGMGSVLSYFRSFSLLSRKPPLTFRGRNAILTALFVRGCYALKQEGGKKMATSSITANFACNDSKAANTFVELMFSQNVDSSWIARQGDRGGVPCLN